MHETVTKRVAVMVGVAMGAVLLALVMHLFRPEPIPPPPGDAPRTRPAQAAAPVRSRVPDRTSGAVGRPAAPPGVVSPWVDGSGRTADADAWPVMPDAIPDEYVLTFFNARDRAAFEALAAQAGIHILDRTSLANALRIYAPDAARLRLLLKAAPSPMTFMPNGIVRIPPLPEGGAPAEAPAQPYVGFGDQTLAWLGIPSPAPTLGRGIRVAVLDTGIPVDFAGEVAGRTDMTGEGNRGAAHGGAVAALIAGPQGLVPGADLLDIKVLDAEGSGNAFTLAKGIVEAVDQGADVLNLSIETKGDHPVLEAAVRYAQERGVLLVAAVGNGGVAAVSYPARYEDVLAVGGVDAERQHLYFSNRGPEVDLVAPAIGLQVPGIDGQDTSFSGTSAAAPLVAAAAALLLAETPDMPPAALADLLKAYSYETGAPGPDEETGAGVLDVGRLQSRHAPGIVDMVAIRPHVRLQEAADRVLVDVFAQNQGTMPVPQVTMDIVVNEHPQTVSFSNVGVNATVSHTITIPLADVERDGIDTTVQVWPLGMEDATPHNNQIRSVVLPNR